MLTYRQGGVNQYAYTWYNIYVCACYCDPSPLPVGNRRVLKTLKESEVFNFQRYSRFGGKRLKRHTFPRTTLTYITKVFNNSSCINGPVYDTEHGRHFGSGPCLPVRATSPRVNYSSAGDSSILHCVVQASPPLWRISLAGAMAPRASHPPHVLIWLIVSCPPPPHPRTRWAMHSPYITTRPYTAWHSEATRKPKMHRQVLLKRKRRLLFMPSPLTRHLPQYGMAQYVLRRRKLKFHRQVLVKGRAVYYFVRAPSPSKMQVVATMATAKTFRPFRCA